MSIKTSENLSIYPIPTLTLPPMPGKLNKHVRFSRTTTFHSPPTPALSIGSLSPASSTGPLTPPPLAGVGLPGPSPYVVSYAKPQPQPRFPAPVHLHALLRFSNSPAINFDLTHHPSAISIHHRVPSQRELSEAATNPPLQMMTLHSQHLPWVITVSPSNGSFVTILDVLDVMYRTLRISITPNEWHSLPTQNDMRRVSASYEHRYKRARSAREYEEEKGRGVRRIDFLMGYTRFLGLAPTSQGPNAWVLNTA